MHYIFTYLLYKCIYIYKYMDLILHQIISSRSSNTIVTKKYDVCKCFHMSC